MADFLGIPRGRWPIAMTAVLIAVYLPIAFQGGLTGALFIEFAFTLVGTIVISTIVALTLSPMMCSRLLKPHDEHETGLQARITRFIDRRFEGLHDSYSRRLHGVLNYVPVTLAFAVVVILGTASLWMTTQQDVRFAELTNCERHIVAEFVRHKTGDVCNRTVKAVANVRKNVYVRARPACWRVSCAPSVGWMQFST